MTAGPGVRTVAFGRVRTLSEHRPAPGTVDSCGSDRESNYMGSALRTHLWNRTVLLVFALPALGYLAFLSQFAFGDPTGPVRAFLEGTFLFALPAMALYSTLLDALGPVDRTLGTAGFFVFTYVLAVGLAWATRQGRRLVRRYRM